MRKIWPFTFNFLLFAATACVSPFIVLVCTRAEDDCRLSAGREYALFDTGLATQNLLLQGVREGLHAHPIAGFSPEPIKSLRSRVKESVLPSMSIPSSIWFASATALRKSASTS